MNTNQLEIIKWWHEGCDYQQGIMLFARISRNKVMIHTFMKKQKKFGHRKLKYELTKAVGLDWKKIPPARPSGPKTKVHSAARIKTPPVKKQAAAPVTRDKKPEIKQVQKPAAKPSVPPSDKQPEKQYPPVIRKIKYQYAELYNKRGILHKQMRNIPPDNSEKNINQRAFLLIRIHEMSRAMDDLYVFLEGYEKEGIIPPAELVWPPKVKETPVDIKGLKNRKKRLQSANSKDRNQLQYQQYVKGEKDNPIPPGPKRQKLEMRIKKREREISEIEQKLVDLENVDKSI